MQNWFSIVWKELRDIRRKLHELLRRIDDLTTKVVSHPGRTELHEIKRDENESGVQFPIKDLASSSKTAQDAHPHYANPVQSFGEPQPPQSSNLAGRMVIRAVILSFTLLSITFCIDLILILSNDTVLNCSKTEWFGSIVQCGILEVFQNFREAKLTMDVLLRFRTILETCVLTLLTLCMAAIALNIASYLLSGSSTKLMGSFLEQLQKLFQTNADEAQAGPDPAALFWRKLAAGSGVVAVLAAPAAIHAPGALQNENRVRFEILNLTPLEAKIDKLSEILADLQKKENDPEIKDRLKRMAEELEAIRKEVIRKNNPDNPNDTTLSDSLNTLTAELKHLTEKLASDEGLNVTVKPGPPGSQTVRQHRVFQIPP